ncbi:MAG: redoxin domain-containing protein [Bryobacteraceae bacterium]|nr:redoxin domain-containing protein [Bryobacteraceae bacterium]MDW8376892.1 redoxin domain-containing protein [Bryobacterales bacterium]
MPSLSVVDLSGKSHRVDTTGRITVVVFVSTICPISNDYNDRLIALYREFEPRGVQWLFLNSNSNETATDILRHTEAAGFPFSIYQDPGNHVADRLGATVTPQAFLLDRQGIVRYRGQIDDARNPARVSVHALKQALEDLLAGRMVARQETRAFGCTIKRVKKSS